MPTLTQLRRSKWRLHPFVSGLEAAMAALRHRTGGGPAPVRVLLLSDGANYTSEQQFAPLRRHAAAMRRELGVVLQQRTVRQGLQMTPGALSGFDMVGFKLSFMTPRAEAERIAGHFRQTLRGHATRLVYFDGDDDLCVQWPGVLGAVDLYVKKHVFADTSAYLRRYEGKTNLTDYIASHHGVSFADNPIPHCEPLPHEQLGKIVPGWNVALDDKIVDLHAALAAADAGPALAAADAGPALAAAEAGRAPAEGGLSLGRRTPKDIDVSCRASVPPTTWTYPLRNQAVERMEAMAGRLRVLAPRDRVSQSQYYQEMLRSRLCVSPFGYGELCWRDFEAILCGCVLVKPDMGHVRTVPDVFVPHVTYVPVKWDFSDLEPQCARYLADEPARRRIADAALTVLDRGFTEAAFVGSFAMILRRLGLAAPAAAD